MAFGSFENRSGNHTMSEINMVPLIDVMLVLLVIFIITAPLLTHSIKINLPHVSAQASDQKPETVDLAVDAQGNFFWNDTPVALDQLTAKLQAAATHDPQPELRIRADLNTRYEVLAQLMGMARSVGLSRLGFVTRPADSAKPVTNKANQPPGDAAQPS